MEDYESIVRNIVKKIADGAKPEKVVLFGSFAFGNPHKDSDLDLLVIKNSSLRRDERDKEIRMFLKDVIFPMDIFVYTPKEVESLKKFPSSFLSKIMNTGKVVYERK